MKTYTVIAAALLAIFCFVAEAAMRSLPKEATLIELAKQPNPTLNLVAPKPETILEGINSLSTVYDADVRSSLRELVETLTQYEPPPIDKQGNVERELQVCRLARTATLNYIFYQQAYHRKALRGDLKKVTETTLLLCVKKLQWVTARERFADDDFFHVYYSTLRRYLDVVNGKIIINGAWVIVPVEKPNP